jgi:predicted GNAT superfamily acetyltransferase
MQLSGDWVRRQDHGNVPLAEEGVRGRADFTVRPCLTQDELAACIEIQKLIWAYSERDVYPPRFFRNLVRIGGHVLGAFSHQERLIGFVASSPAWRGDHRYFYSLALGVVPEFENQGVGRALKFAQRRMALREGIDCIEWTFDPLRTKNAHFNITRLGAIARRYIPDYYGPVESSLQKGLPSDRLIAEWWLKSARVRTALAGKPPRNSRREPAAEVHIPPDVGGLLESNPAEAQGWQGAVRAQIQGHFAQNLLITGFAYTGKSARYLLDHDED